MTTRIQYQWLGYYKLVLNKNNHLLRNGGLAIAHHHKQEDSEEDRVALYYIKDNKLTDRCEIRFILPEIDLFTSTWRHQDYILMPSCNQFIEFVVVRRKETGN